MGRSELLAELRKLPPPERLAVIAATLQELGSELDETPATGRDADTWHQRDRDLAAAARALAADYAAGGELTAFTALDSEDFLEPR